MCLPAPFSHFSTSSWYLACFLSFAFSVCPSQTTVSLSCLLDNNYVRLKWCFIDVLRDLQLLPQVSLQLQVWGCIEETWPCSSLSTGLLSSFDKGSSCLWGQDGVCQGWWRCLYFLRLPSAPGHGTNCSDLLQGIYGSFNVSVTHTYMRHKYPFIHNELVFNKYHWIHILLSLKLSSRHLAYVKLMTEITQQSTWGTFLFMCTLRVISTNECLTILSPNQNPACQYSSHHPPLIHRLK